MKLYRSILTYVFVVLANTVFGQPSDLTLEVMDELGIHLKDCEGSLFAEKILPYDDSLSVIVIPKIGKQEEGMYTLDSYILIVNNKTGKTKHHYFESYTTSGWESDAIYITKIAIDTAPYLVQENTRAFGVVIHNRSMSHPNPYSSSFISLFIPDGDRLKNILKNYETYTYGGETDTNCLGKFYSETKIIILSKNKTNGFFDLETKSTNAEIIYKEKGNDCIESKTTTISKQTLKYSNGTYRTQK